MEQDIYIDSLVQFLRASSTPFHCVEQLAQHFENKGFVKLREAADWSPLAPGRYYVSRNDSSLIAFIRGTERPEETGMRLMAAHTDSPALKVKPNPWLGGDGPVRLGVETYGGAIQSTWFDRDLSLAGRVTFRQKDGTLAGALIDFREPLAIIPSLAVHLDRDTNNSKSMNPQKELVPVLLQPGGDSPADFHSLLCQQLCREYPQCAADKVLGFDLFFYGTQPPALLGANREFLAGSRLDNLLSCHAIAEALVTGTGKEHCLAAFHDHEEVGSVSTAGANGSFLSDILERLLPDAATRQRCFARSFLISADNAHGFHPNYPEKHDPNHLPQLNGGPAIKINANQRYATDCVSAAMFRMLGEEAGVPVQEFVMRSDMPCGSTIGPMTSARTGIRTVDVGIPSLAMHSIRETAGKTDCWQLFKTLREYVTMPSHSRLWKGFLDNGI